MTDQKKWETLYKESSKRGTSRKKVEEITDVLLENRGIKSKKNKREFLDPIHPEKMGLKELGISDKSIKKAIERIKEAKESGEKVIVYGDYDADGICATAILWETLYSIGVDALPYIPERFSEGYGINAESVQKLKNKNQKLKIIITVDNGIVANEAVETANNLGIDVIITDHHTKGKELPSAYCLIHTTKIGGAGLAWVFVREILSKLPATNYQLQSSLELAAIGTIADQLSLIGPNRSFAKYGLEALNKTVRPGLLALFEEAGIRPGNLGTYEVNFVIAPRINAMGRLEHAIDSLRLLCTLSPKRAKDLAQLLGSTNQERQRIVEEVVVQARQEVSKRQWRGAIVLAHESYHEGVIGLAASKLVEEFYRPVIVFSKGEEFSKASARSISGFNIINAIRKLNHLTEGGGGHPMAAGFSVKTNMLETFIEEFEEVSQTLLSNEILQRVLKIDLEIQFNQINKKLVGELRKFEPLGAGNPAPVFCTFGVKLLDVRTVGRDRRHLKLMLEKEGREFEAIAFGMGVKINSLIDKSRVDLAYNLEKNIWNGDTILQLKVKDINF